MKKTLLYIIVAILLCSIAEAQTLRIERTDVDSSRYGHITANFKFGIDIYIDELENVNSSSFQLRWNFGDYVHFSGYKIGDFGEKGTVYITNPKMIPGTGDKYMNVGIFSGTTVGENDFDNPKLLHLEFAVSNDIPNRESLVFSFVNFFATAYIDSTQTNVEITSEQLELNIHSFINVWPGDSNNDGMVDTRDYNQIGLYFEGNSIQNDGRSFKRKNASIMWTGQKVLVWDNADATFADCDGDGVITVADGMVVFHNDSKIHNEGTGLLGESNSDGLQEPIDQSNYKKIPIFAEVNQEYRAITTRAKLPTNIHTKAIIAGDLFDNTDAHILSHIDNNTLELTIGSFDKDFKINKAGIIAYILVDKDAEVKHPLIANNSTILNSKNQLQSTGTTTDVSETDENFEILINNSELTISSEELIKSVVIVDLNGRILNRIEAQSRNIDIPNEYKTGTYVLLIETSKVSIKTINIVK